MTTRGARARAAGAPALPILGPRAPRWPRRPPVSRRRARDLREGGGAPAALPRAPHVLTSFDLDVVGVGVPRAVGDGEVRAVLPRLRVGVLRVRLVRVGRVVAELPGVLERRRAAHDALPISRPPRPWWGCSAPRWALHLLHSRGGR